MAQEEVVKSVEMFFQEGTSDKVYNVALVEVSEGVYTVRVAWGRRGTPLQTGTKAVEVPVEKAEKAYDKVVRQKTKKGVRGQDIGAQADRGGAAGREGVRKQGVEGRPPPSETEGAAAKQPGGRRTPGRAG